MEIKNSVTRGTKLHEHNRRFFDCNVPVILEHKHKAPDGKRHELWISLEKSDVFVDVDPLEVIAQAAKRPEDIQAARFWFRLFARKKAVKHREHALLQAGLAGYGRVRLVELVEWAVL